jgi:hypothetical protein
MLYSGIGSMTLKSALLTFLCCYTVYAHCQPVVGAVKTFHQNPCAACERKSPYAFNDSLYIPTHETPIKEIQCNLIFLHKDDGTGGFDLVADAKVLTDIETRINQMLSGLFTTDESQKNNDCFAGVIHDSRIRIRFTQLSLNNTQYWDNKNGNGPTCPGSPDFFLEPLDKDLRNKKACPEGINIFFTESSEHYTKFLKGEPIQGKFSKQGCSLTSGCEIDSTNLKINAKSVYLDFMMKQTEELKMFPDIYFDKTEIAEPAKGNNTYWWFISETAGGVLHEIGHCLFADVHHRNYCADHIMRQTNPRHYFTPLDLGEAHRWLTVGTVSKYVVPYTPLEDMYYVTGEKFVDYDWRCYQNITIQKGGLLTVKCRLRMPEGGTIKVMKGGRLVIDGGIVTSVGSGSWLGIQKPKFANKKRAQRLSPFVIKNNGVIENSPN